MHPAVAIVLGVLVSSCGGDPAGPDPTEDPVFPADFATSYTLVGDDRNASPPHNNCIRVYCNPGASAAGYTAGNGSLPEGTVLVKQVHDNGGVGSQPCSGVTGYVAMRKGAPGSAPASGDWYWQELDASMNVVDSGQIATCIGCHSQAGNLDWTLLQNRI